jgi:D-Ala-D-Ala ligase-like protein
VEAVQTAALTSFQALQLLGNARFDFRITPDYEVHLIEATPDPDQYSRAEFMRAARASGWTHPQTIHEILVLAMSRDGFQEEPERRLTSAGMGKGVGSPPRRDRQGGGRHAGCQGLLPVSAQPSGCQESAGDERELGHAASRHEDRPDRFPGSHP